MKGRAATAATTAALLGLAAVAAPSALALVPAPAWSVQALAGPTNFSPGDVSGLDHYEAFLTNSGGVASDRSPITIIDTLPKGLGIKSVALHTSRQEGGKDFGPSACETQTVGEVSTVTCTIEEGVLPGAIEPALVNPSEQLQLVVRVTVPPAASGLLVNQVGAQGGGAEDATAIAHNQASEEEAPAGFQEFQAALTGLNGKPASAAASHPYQYTTSFAVNLNPAPPSSGSGVDFIPAQGDLKDIEVALPAGLVGNPIGLARCSAQQFNTFRLVESENTVSPNECPDGSAVGVVKVEQLEGNGGVGAPIPLYNLMPPPGMPAQLGFRIVGVPFYINTKLRSDSDYGISAYLQNITEVKRVTAAQVTVWGTPADPSHDSLRGLCALVGGNCPANLNPVKPFFRLPSSCALELPTTMSFDTWLHPGTFLSSTDTEAAPVACNQPDFSPTIEAHPTTNVADSPSGLDFDLHLPQKANEDPEGLGEADLREATVTLPPGLVVNPSSADGLGACSLAQIGYQGIKEGHASFSAEPANCPDAAKIGTVEVNAPAVDHPLPGAVYLARQGENPFNSLIAIYIAISDPQTGVVVKLPGKVVPDPLTGQLSTTVSPSPQVPFEDFRFHFFAGARAPLRTPQTCGEAPTVPSFTTTTSLTPWSAPEGATAHPSSSFAIAQAPGGGACATTKAALPNAPSFEAGTASPVAGAYSPFLLRLKREDGSQELAGLNLTLPLGLTARLAGTAECSEAAIAAARAREVPGQGATEQSSPSCPASSHLGTVTVGAGSGPSPFYAQGNAYLAGPYKGAPLSMAIITPAVAGPFDLGAVVVRAALQVDPETAKVTTLSDPLPRILQGIPLDVRSIAVRIDKPDFTLNPTSCEAKALSGEAISTQNQVANLNNRFQVGGCSNLAFKPKLALKLKGATGRGGHPALSATLTYPKGGGYSNIAKAQVALPHSEFLDTTHIKTICTRVQFAVHSCPAGSIYGYAKAVTPLLDKPLEGPVYLRSSSHPLPDLVIDLNGQIHIALVGRVDSVNGGTRNSFEAVPDAPVSSFSLTLQSGKKGLLVNSTDICQGTHRATAIFTAQNGKVLEAKPPLQASCKGKGKKHKHKHKGRAPHHRPRP
jgi:hypothetical protein